MKYQCSKHKGEFKNNYKKLAHFIFLVNTNLCSLRMQFFSFYSFGRNLMHNSQRIIVHCIVKQKRTQISQTEDLLIEILGVTQFLHLFSRSCDLERDLEVLELFWAHLFYDFRCKESDCTNLPNKQMMCTGLTTCKLSQRLSFHLHNGAIKENFPSHHGKILSIAIDDTKEIFILYILEPLTIRFEDHDINMVNRRKLHLFVSTL